MNRRARVGVIVLLVCAGIAIIVLVVWAVKRWRTSHNESTAAAMRMAIGSLVFVVFEGLLGRSLVLTGNTALNLTPERPFWMAGHLINTFILLAFLTLTAYYASGGGSVYGHVGIVATCVSARSQSWLRSLRRANQTGRQFAATCCTNVTNKPDGPYARASRVISSLLPPPPATTTASGHGKD